MNALQRDPEGNDNGKSKTLCSFCGTTKNITKEHVLPRWMFEKGVLRNFTSNNKNLDKIYSKATIPACKVCNSELLSSMEIYILQLLRSNHTANSELSVEEKENIIRWLEIIDYKFHVFRAYSKSREVGNLKRSFNRLAVKKKDKNLCSLVLLDTNIDHFRFFHTIDQFIFLEFPMQQLAIFYFYTRTFTNMAAAKKEALKIVKEHF